MDVIEVEQWPIRREFGLNVAMGSVYNHSVTHVFGFNETVSIALSTIWDGDNGRYIYPQSASVMTVSSSSVNDAASGTGARLVYISGLDANYDIVTEIVITNGQSAVSTQNSYLRIQRMDVVNAGSLGTADGDIYIGVGALTLGVPATSYGKIGVGKNSTLMGMITIPAGYTGFLTDGSISTGSAVNNKYLTAYLAVRPYMGVFNVSAVVTMNQSRADFKFGYPIRIPEKTDVEAQAYSSGDTFAVSSHFEIVLMKND